MSTEAESTMLSEGWQSTMSTRKKCYIQFIIPNVPFLLQISPPWDIAVWHSKLSPGQLTNKIAGNWHEADLSASYLCCCFSAGRCNTKGFHQLGNWWQIVSQEPTRPLPVRIRNTWRLIRWMRTWCNQWSADRELYILLYCVRPSCPRSTSALQRPCIGWIQNPSKVLLLTLKPEKGEQESIWRISLLI